MLKQLFIQNYAIIEELEIDFSRHFNVITGETGAGKSIIVGALGLILGERADSSALVNKEKKCVIEGHFGVAKKKAIAKFIEQHDIDQHEELIVRREITANGKSRAFINDTPVTLVQLNHLSRLLVDLHQQFDTLELGESDFQRDILDALAGNAGLLGEYHTAFRQWQQVKKQSEELRLQQQQFEKEADYNRFQFNELEEAAFRDNELEDIDAELKMLNNSEGIKTVLNKVNFDLKESEAPLVQQLKALINQLQSFSDYHPALPVLLDRMQSAQIELQDIAGEIDNISAEINYDPERVERLNDRLSLGYKLQKKHGVNSTIDLIIVRQQLEEKLQAVLNIEETITYLEKEMSTLYEQVLQLGKKISENRQKQIKPFEEKVNRLLAQVGMPNARIKVQRTDAAPAASGTDNIEFLFDANLPSGETGKAAQFQPVHKVASGGELSRLMLCIKSLVAKSIDLPTLIFDEIDTGISGEAARQVGIIMKELSSRLQVICITHQPQIAGKADAHFFVYKDIVKNKVHTHIRQLTNEERITTIAKMLSGEKPTAAAIENAREMVSN